MLLAATALPPRLALQLGGFAAACATVLIFIHYPLPWDEPLELPAIYTMGVWLSLLLALGFIGVYAWQLTEEARQLVDALAATELVLAGEQHLTQLDGLAAAAAHELGTPLSTITVIATELEREIAPDSPHADDVRLLRAQAQRCRGILGKLTQLSSSVEPFDRMPLSALIEETVAPHRNFGVAIDVALAPHDAVEPIGGRNPAILYGPRQSARERGRFSPTNGSTSPPTGAAKTRSWSADQGIIDRDLRPRSWTGSAKPYVFRRLARRHLAEPRWRCGRGLGLEPGHR